MFLLINTSCERIFFFFFENVLTLNAGEFCSGFFCVASSEENCDSVFGVRKFVRAAEQTRKGDTALQQQNGSD